MTTNRWLPVVGGVLMNLALGSFYAWSVFVLPLEKEFGWTRTDTSWAKSINSAITASREPTPPEERRPVPPQAIA